MTPAQFIVKWSRAVLSERAASQEHFIDLCRLLGQPTPAEHDATGAEYTFEKGVFLTGPASSASRGDRGFADVWWRGKFAWEYKRKDKYKDLVEAYRQLCRYREALENPPLLVVCDIRRTEIHTNFTGTVKQVYCIDLDDLDQAPNLDLLRRVFTDPDSFRPAVTTIKVTETVAEHIAKIAGTLQLRGHEPHTAAHFLMKCMFCLFAEDVGLLPNDVFSGLLESWHEEPAQLTGVLSDLFAKMRTGGAFGICRIPHFNGGLFDDAPALPLARDEAIHLLFAARQDWSAVEPAIFGTLFERSLDPSKRSQIGAHYTSRDDILLVVEPVILAPLRRQWQAVQADVAAQLERRRKATTWQTKNKAEAAISAALNGFMERLGSVRILDPACGSGNFLYVAIQQLLFLEKEVIRFAAATEIGLGLLPTVRPTQLAGLEINPYAAELAGVVVWIGYLQWMHQNGFNTPRDPILQPLKTIECRDAILAWADENGSPIPAWREGAKCTGPADWPQADFIVGNPPFLGGNLVRQFLGDEYVAAMFAAYDLPKFSDLCCYWFERAREVIECGKKYGGTGFGQSGFGQGGFGKGVIPYVRVGLLATQGIRGGANRKVLERIKQTGDIFMAWSDRDWVLDGANVHVSIAGFGDGTEKEQCLDGLVVTSINANLSSGTDLTTASVLHENLCIQHEADKKGGPFDVDLSTARRVISAPTVCGGASLDVCRPWCNGLDITRRSRQMWIIDFGTAMPLEKAAKFEAAFEYLKRTVAPLYESKRQSWWLHERPRPAMRQALGALPRYLATPMLTKFRLFVWLDHTVLPDHQLVVFARSDDYFFGVLHSSVHELWARRMGTQLREAESGFRYTPTTCFETFPLPWPPGKEPGAADSSQATGPARPGSDPIASGEPAIVRHIAGAAAALNEQRERWLNPPEWIEPIAAAVDAADTFADVPEEARALIRRSAIQAAAAKDPRLKKRTLTNLYNERPTWLKLAHRELDAAVLAAYAAVDPEGGWGEDWADAWADSGAGQPLPAGHPLAARRAEVDQKVLANLLRMNLARAGDGGR